VRYRQLYPENWEEIARVRKEQAGWCCECCGIAQGTSVISQRTGVVYKVALAAAHLDHDPWNPEARLAVLCQSCHARYDYSERERERWLALEQLRHRVWLEAHGYVFDEE
jgi:hypothetical protein